MKLIPLFGLSILCLFNSSCKKTEITQQEDTTVTKIKSFVKSQISQLDYNELDWNKMIFYDRNGKHETAKIPIHDKTNNETQKALYISLLNESYRGNYVEITKKGLDISIVNTSLDRKTIIIPKIENGYADGNYKLYKDGVLNYDSEITTPSVVSTRTYEVSYTYENNTYLLYSLFELGVGNPPNGNPTGNQETVSYINDNPTFPANGGNVTSEIIDIEFDESETSPAVNLTKLFKCLDEIPSAGATYELTLCSDIPVNNHPDFPINTEFSPGHSFLIIRKTNGFQFAIQAFGFYPTSKSVTSVSSKIVDDYEHEINASIKMNITEAQFQTLKGNSISLASQDYNIISNNCTNFALDLFNQMRPAYSWVVVDPYNALIPPAPPIFIPKAPQGLYKALVNLKNTSSIEQNNITIDNTHNYKAPMTNHECD